ncbi:MAG: outer membrane beta-barrel protein [Holosporaceae bacterium]|nr:outer membrane beta-barrel protein [Holosporaceae bacterium]
MNTKKLCLLIILLHWYGYALAEGVTVEKQAAQEFYPKSGIYFGLGVSSADEDYDFTLNSFPDPGNHYMASNYRNKVRKYSGQLCGGYKIYDPFFAAIEVNYTLNKTKVEKRYDDCIPAINVFGHCASLLIKRGNDVSFLLKIGKGFAVEMGKAGNFYVTPYVSVGFHRRNTEVSFAYPTSEGMHRYALNLMGVYSDFGYANRNLNSSKTGFLYGIGLDLSLEDSLSIKIEYNFQRSGELTYQTTIGANPIPGGNDIDRLGKSRYYLLKNKNAHILSIGITKSFQLDRLFN